MRNWFMTFLCKWRNSYLHPILPKKIWFSVGNSRVCKIRFWRSSALNPGNQRSEIIQFLVVYKWPHVILEMYQTLNCS
jgi:hypothetical protein